MALKSYDLVRKSDDAQFTMRLDEDDRAKYTKAGWKVTESKSKVAAKPSNLAAKAAAAKGKADEGDADTTVVD